MDIQTRGFCKLWWYFRRITINPDAEQVVTAMSMMPLTESLSIPFFTKYISTANEFIPEESVAKSALTMLTELERWAGALKAMRASSTLISTLVANFEI